MYTRNLKRQQKLQMQAFYVDNRNVNGCLEKRRVISHK